MRIVESRVSAGDREIFDLNVFLSQPLYAHLAHSSEQGPRESPVWFHWDGEAIWIIGGATFPTNLKRDPRCALGIVDWEPTTGLSRHVGIRGTAEVLPFDPATARTIFRKYFGPDQSEWDRRFDDVFTGELGLELVRITPDTVVIRDQSYRPTRWAQGQRAHSGTLVAAAQDRIGRDAAEYVLRPGRPDEAEAILTLWRQAEATVSPTDTVPDLGRALVDSHTVLLLAERQGRLLGSVLAAFDGWRGNLYRLAVHPDARRRGLARALVAEAERHLAQRGVKRITALVEKDHPWATAFWSAVGYERDVRMERFVHDLDIPGGSVEGRDGVSSCPPPPLA